MNSSSENLLGAEDSLYLRQHANNPVHWLPWSTEAFEKAAQENKLVLVSIGYSSCHWCHVMEHESFEDVEVAKVMNEYLVCIKVDREERPDIDLIYMNALQLMSGQGGWPLNCFVLPDGRPIYGGTYFPKERWISVIHHLNALLKDEPDKVFAYAEKLTQGVQLSDKIIPDNNHVFNKQIVVDAITKWKSRWDLMEGGPNHSPKFPLPTNFLFLLRYGVLANDAAVLSYVKLSLDKMAMGGIYDQVGGGFMRYSTDMIWKVPHFEKMLYDNAQLISLYAEAYRYFKSDLYKEIVEETIAFANRNWLHEGSFFSSTDADSEGEEGKFYVWTKEEFSKVCTVDADWAASYFSMNQIGFWEHGNYILLRREPDEYWAEKLNVSLIDFKLKVKSIKEKLNRVREKRIKPVTDTKKITSWNALMLNGICDAYKALQDEKLKEQALQLGHEIMSKALRSDGGLNHLLSESKSINGFLEDYAFVIESFISLYEINSDIQWLDRAEQFLNYVQAHFYDQESGLFFFTSDSDPILIARKTEFSDNVIPSSNSSLAKSFFYFSELKQNAVYREQAENMLKVVSLSAAEYAAGFSNWLQLYLHQVFPFSQLVICGPDHEQHKFEFFLRYYPNIMVLSSAFEQDLALFKNRFKNKETLLYLCVDNSCKLPVKTVEELTSQL